MQKANNSQDLLNVANALAIASRGEANTTFMSIEHAKNVWRKYLEISEYDVPKKEFPLKINSNTSGVAIVDKSVIVK